MKNGNHLCLTLYGACENSSPIIFYCTIAVLLTSGDLICNLDRPELLLPTARCTPLWRDVLLGKSPLPGMKAISTVLSSLVTQHIQRHVQSDVHSYNIKNAVVLCRRTVILNPPT